MVHHYTLDLVNVTIIKKSINDKASVLYLFEDFGEFELGDFDKEEAKSKLYFILLLVPGMNSECLQ